MPDWIPISPTLDRTGAFAALSNLPNAALLRPVPLAPTQAPFGIFTETERVLDLSMAAQLGVAAVFDASAALQTRTLTHEVTVHSEQDTTAPVGGLILGTAWGAGIRTRIDVTRINAKVKLSVGAIAAAASMGLVSASYTIEGMGLADPFILAMLPGPGRFDEPTRMRISAAIHAVKQRFLLPRRSLTSVPFRILVPNPSAHFPSPLGKARAQLFAMRQLRLGAPEAAALAGAARHALNGAVVSAVYRGWAGITSPTAAPSADVVRKADAWISSIAVE